MAKKKRASSTPPRQATTKREPTALGDMIRSARTRKGLTQTALGVQIERSTGTVCDYERGRKTPRADVLVRLARVLDLSAERALRAAAEVR